MRFASHPARLSRAGWLLLLPACIDYTPAGKPGDSVAPVSDSAAETDTPDDSAPPDEECVLALEGTSSLAAPHACVNVVPLAAEPWNVELMWTADSEVECQHPVVADIDGDGNVEVLCPGTFSNVVSVIDGRTGETKARWEGFQSETHLAIADVDADGALEVVGIDPDFVPVAVSGTGAVRWRGAIPLAQGSYSYSVEVRDLDGDGQVEVLSHKGAVRGVDGSLWGTFDRRNEWQRTEFQVAAEDFDGDGTVDLAYDWYGWDVARGRTWDRSPDSVDRGFAIPMPVQADTDENAEILWVTMDHFVLAEDDGTALVQYSFLPTDRTYASTPCAGDLDGDGQMDVFTTGLDRFHARSLDGATLWASDMSDITGGWGGCTTFDFDLDGAREVVAVDSQAVYILDGSTGATLYYGTDGFDTSTLNDIPLVVDLDGDGSVEILVPSPSNQYGTQLHAWRNVNRDWPPGTQMWPSTTWSGTSLLPDGRVPRTPQRPWLTTQVWRGQPELPIFGSDLRPEVRDTCVASCADDGEVRVAVQLQNLGPDEVEAGAPLAVYGLDDAGARVLLAVFTLADWLDDGRAAASWEVVTTTAQATRGLVFVAGDDGTGTVHPDDCDTANSTLAWALDACP